MSDTDFISYSDFASALPASITEWTQPKLLALGYGRKPKLRYLRIGTKFDEPKWLKLDVLAWFEARYSSFPSLVALFRRNLTEPKRGVKEKPPA